jgi:hypothetical protein
LQFGLKVAQGIAMVPETISFRMQAAAGGKVELQSKPF